MPTAVPDVEVADDRYALRVRRPHREAHAVDAVDARGRRAQAVEHGGRVAGRETRERGLVEQRAERIRVVGDLAGVRPVDGQPVAAVVRERAREAAGVVDARERTEFVAVGRHRPHALRAGQQRAHDDPAGVGVWAETRERVRMAAGEQRVDVGAVEQHVGHRLPPWSGARSVASRRSISAASPPTGTPSQSGRFAAS